MNEKYIIHLYRSGKSVKEICTEINYPIEDIQNICDIIASSIGIKMLHGRVRWTELEDSKLSKLILDGKCDEDISIELGRTIRAVVLRRYSSNVRMLKSSVTVVREERTVSEKLVESVENETSLLKAIYHRIDRNTRAVEKQTEMLERILNSLITDEQDLKAIAMSIKGDTSFLRRSKS